jgi:hypothetical protein
MFWSTEHFTQIRWIPGAQFHVDGQLDVVFGEK